MALTLETITLPEKGELDIEFKLNTYIHITAVEARRKVNIFVTQHIANLLRGETPDLVWRETGAFWRVPIALTTISKGRLGTVGIIDVDVENGELITYDNTIEQIKSEAKRLADNAAL